MNIAVVTSMRLHYVLQLLLLPVVFGIVWLSISVKWVANALVKCISICVNQCIMALLEKPNRERGFAKERIIRVLLNHTGDDLTKYRLAQVADASES